jgi:hypothetical protein
MKISKEYEEFLEEFAHRKHTLYEKFCNISEEILPVPVPSGYEKKAREAINFCHLDVNPTGTFSFALLSAIVFSVVLLIFAYFFNFLSIPFFVLLSVFTFSIFYYLYSYPFTLAISFRIRASSEMVLAILYMTISMKVVPNIEQAVKFAASNLTGPLAKDLKKVLWDVYVGRFTSVMDALDVFIEKWKRESQEFTEALTLLKTAFFESTAQREKVLNEAVGVVLSGTKERMKNYAQELKSPITVLNALGILLPLIGLIFFPIMSIFLPETIKPIFLVIGYDIILPIVVYWMMKNYLEKRPSTFHQPEIPESKFFNVILFFSMSIPILLVAFSYYEISMINEIFNQNLLIYSLVITWAISFGIISFCIFSTINRLKLRDKIAQVESEIGEVLFQIGSQLTRGIPIENALKASLPRIKELKMHDFVEKILYNIETFGMTFSSAVFDANAGVINYYPSRLIAAVMRAVTEIAKGGTAVLSDAMISISQYLKNMHSVEEDLKEMLEEPASSMQMQAIVLAPLSSGIVVSLTAMVMQILVGFKEFIDKIQTQLNNYGPLGAAGKGIFNSIINVDQIMPVYSFQLIVGIYMIEVVCMISIFLSIIKFGEDNLLRRHTLGKTLLLAIAIYSGVLLFIYFSFISLMPIMGLIRA